MLVLILRHYTDLLLGLQTEKVDLVDLSRASGLLRFRAVRDGIVLFEAPKGQYQKLWLDAVHFWQAVQLTIDTALSACVHLHLGTPSSYAGAFYKLSEG